MSEHNNNEKNGLRVEVINLSYSLESNHQSSFPWEKQNNWKKMSIQLLSNISFIVEKGELCGLLGSSGAGKRYMYAYIFNAILYMDLPTYLHILSYITSFLSSSLAVPCWM